MSNGTRFVLGISVVVLLFCGYIWLTVATVEINEEVEPQKTEVVANTANEGPTKNENAVPVEFHKGSIEEYQERIDWLNSLCTVLSASLSFQTEESIYREIGVPNKVEKGSPVRGSSMGVNQETYRVDVMQFTGVREDWHYQGGILHVERRKPDDMEESFIKIVGWEAR